MDQEDLKWLEDKNVDISDLLAWVVTKWKPIIIFGILTGIFSLLVFFIIPEHLIKEDESAPPKTLEALQSSLSEADALEVENAFNDYLIFQNYNKELSSFSSVFLNTEESGGKIMVAKYYIVSSLKYCSSFYTDIAISSENYQKIYEIAYPNVSGGEDIAAKKTCPFQFLSERDELSDGILITAYIKADTEEQCKGILDVINSSFEKETQRLKESDSKISCSCLDAGYISNQNSFYDNAEKMVVERLHVVNKALATLKSNHINKFSDKQKEYYDYLIAGQSEAKQNKAAEESKVSEGTTAPADPADSAESSDNEKKEELTIPPVTFIKYIGTGFLVGVFLAADFFVLVYIFNGTVNSYKELGQFGIQTLETTYHDKGKGLINGIVRHIREISPTDVAKQLEMLSADIAIRMKMAGTDKLYILITCKEKMDFATAKTIKSLVEKDGVNAAIGNPLDSAEELKNFSDADRVVILAHMKRSKKSTIVKSGAACQRLSKEIFGFIAMDEC